MSATHSLAAVVFVSIMMVIVACGGGNRFTARECAEETGSYIGLISADALIEEGTLPDFGRDKAAKWVERCRTDPDGTIAALCADVKDRHGVNYRLWEQDNC